MLLLGPPSTLLYNNGPTLLGSERSFEAWISLWMLIGGAPSRYRVRLLRRARAKRQGLAGRFFVPSVHAAKEKTEEELAAVWGSLVRVEQAQPVVGQRRRQ